MPATSSNRYSSLSITMHWLMVILLVATAATMELRGMYPKGSDARELIKSAHYALGLAVWMLVWVRLIARLSSTTPAIVPAPSVWQTRLGHTAHAGLYVLMIGLPLVGWLALSFKGTPVYLPGGIPVPLLTSTNSNTAHWLKDLHETGAVAGYVLVGLHAGAALAHHYLLRDNTLVRMLPGKR
ncbi:MULTISPECIES: cytochrome b [Giesbergeria]|uniref:Cytochrome b n=1 Tax=Giesbergeria sinuosa TaxID=80883 RepID=A0ABV9QCD5_9BURK